MVPYIAALIILLVAILFAVYKRVDTFEIVSTTLKVDNTLQVVIDFAKNILQKNSDLIMIRILRILFDIQIILN